jgi:flagellar hook-associated protein 3 FlgL
MTRISTHGAQVSYIARMVEMQMSMHQAQQRVTSEKKSQNYAGISVDTSRLINMENERDLVGRFIENNKTVETKLNVMNDATEAVRKTIKDFRNNLSDFANGNTRDQSKVRATQEWAFRALKDMETYLNMTVDGQYVFSGGRTTTEPVILNIPQLDAFQTKYDGYKVQYPTTRTMNLANSVSNPSLTGSLIFDATSGTIAPSNSNSLPTTEYPVGSTVTVSETTSNNDSFTVFSNTTVVAEAAATGTATAPATISQLKAAGTNITTATTTSLTFAAASGSTDATITAAAGDFTAVVPPVNVGDIIQVSGTGSNNGYYKVTAAAATVLSVRPVISVVDRVSYGTNVTTARLDVKQPTGTPPQAPDLAVTGATLAFDPITNTITDSSGDATFATIPAGATITVSSLTGVDAQNNGTYFVASNTGTVITLAAKTLTSETATAGILTEETYYKGDNRELNHRVDSGREITVGVNASDAAFEKAIRAMALIAQGTYGTPGGLDQNSDRARQALYLLDDAMESPAPGTAPFGTELTSDLKYVQLTIGVNVKIINDKNDLHTLYTSFLETRIGDIENADRTESITALLDIKNSLEASYQTLASIRELSLVKYL